MGLESVAVAVAAVVGSTGLAGLIAGGLQLSRASRLKRAAVEMAAVLKMHEPGTVEFNAAKYALKVVTLDLVAVRLVRSGASTWFNVYIGIATVVLPVAGILVYLAEMFAPVAYLLSFPGIPLLAGSYTVILAAGLWFLLTRSRERFVAMLLEDDEFFPDYVLAYSPTLQTDDRRREFKAVLRKARRVSTGRSQHGSKEFQP